MELLKHEIEQIIRNFNRVLPPAPADFPQAENILCDQNPDGSFRSVDYADPTQGFWKGYRHWEILNVLAGAWHAGHDERYRKAVIDGLEFWSRELPENFNWWWQFCGVPMFAIKILNNMHGDIPAETIERMLGIFDRSDIISTRNISFDHTVKYEPRILANRVSLTNIIKHSIVKLQNRKMEKYTGQNLVFTAYVRMWKGIFYNDPQLVRSGIDELVSEISIAERDKEGVQEDFSYHQHGALLQFGVYGLEFFRDVLNTLTPLKGSSYAVSREKFELMYQYFHRGLKWTCYKNQMDILSCGREVWKKYPREKYDVIASVVNNCGGESEKEFFKNDALVTGSNFFYCSDYLIHRRENRYFSFRMCSSRVLAGESTNDENLQGLYLGCGVMQYKISGDEYDRMPALWDWHHLPALTAVYDDESLYCRGKLNLSSAVGGVCDGENSGVLMSFSSEKLEYNKSVATFGEQVIFTLSDVNNKTAFPVDTTIDSKCYTAPVQVTAEGKTESYTCGTHKLSQVNEIICGASVYSFLQPVDLTLVIEEKETSWDQIACWADGSHRGKSATVYFTGEQSLSYMISPAGVPVEKLESLVIPEVCHVVRDEKSSTVYFFFFAPGAADVPGIGRVSCDRKAAIMLTREKIYLAEVEQQGGKVCFSIDKRVYNVDASKGKYAGKSVSLPR